MKHIRDRTALLLRDNRGWVSLTSVLARPGSGEAPKASSTGRSSVPAEPDRRSARLRPSMRQGFRDPSLGPALDEAISGDPRALYARITRVSGLPGTRINMGVVEAFATECGSRGKQVDPLLRAMVLLDADQAPGGLAHEILPVCAVLALGERGATDAGGRPVALDLLHAAADDLRFRVRDMVPVALARIGKRQGDVLVAEVAPFMDGFFHAAAVLLALSMAPWLDATRNASGVVTRLAEAFDLARNANRAASRYPGHKALMEALVSAPAKIARKYPADVVDEIERWAKVKDPALRDVALGVAKGLRSRFGEDAARIQGTLDRTAPLPRDPTLIVHGTRGRGKKGRLR